MNKIESVNRRSLKKSFLKEGAFKELEIEKKEDLQWEAVKYLCRHEHCTSDEAEEIAQDLVDGFWLDGSTVGRYYNEIDPYFNNDTWFKNQFLNYCARNSEKAIEQYYQY